MKGLAKMITMLIMLTLLIEKEKKRMEKEANGQSYTTHIYTQYMNAHINTIRFSRLITIIKMRRKENLIHQQIKTKKKMFSPSKYAFQTIDMCRQESSFCRGHFDPATGTTKRVLHLKTQLNNKNNRNPDLLRFVLAC